MYSNAVVSNKIMEMVMIKEVKAVEEVATEVVLVEVGGHHTIDIIHTPPRVNMEGTINTEEVDTMEAEVVEEASTGINMEDRGQGITTNIEGNHRQEMMLEEAAVVAVDIEAPINLNSSPQLREVPSLHQDLIDTSIIHKIAIIMAIRMAMATINRMETTIKTVLNKPSKNIKESETQTKK